MMIRTMALLAAAILATPAWAAEPPPSREGTILSLRETAEAQVIPDVLRVVLRAEATGAAPDEVQREVNRRMGQALATARRASEVKAETGAYSAFSSRRTDKSAPEWWASQTLVLSSPAFSTLLELTGRLQESGLATSAMEFSISPEIHRQIQSRLTVEAIAQIRREADTAAAALGLSVASFRTVRLEKASASASPMMLNRAMKAASAPSSPPVAEAGAQTLQVTVEADVGLVAP